MKYRILKIIDETEGRIDEKGKNTRFALKIGTLPGTRRNNNGYIDCAALDKVRSAMGRACTHTRLLTQKKPGFPGYFYLSVSGGGKIRCSQMFRPGHGDKTISAKLILYAIPGQSEIIGAPQNKKARVVRAGRQRK